MKGNLKNKSPSKTAIADFTLDLGHCNTVDSEDSSSSEWSPAIVGKRKDTVVNFFYF